MVLRGKDVVLKGRWLRLRAGGKRCIEVVLGEERVAISSTLDRDQINKRRPAF